MNLPNIHRDLNKDREVESDWTKEEVINAVERGYSFYKLVNIKRKQGYLPNGQSISVFFNRPTIIKQSKLNTIEPTCINKSRLIHRKIYSGTKTFITKDVA